MALFLLLPDLPSGEGLEEQHLEPVLYGGAPFLALFHEERLVGVVEQVVEHVVGRQLLVRMFGQALTLGNMPSGVVLTITVYCDMIFGVISS